MCAHSFDRFYVGTKFIFPLYLRFRILLSLIMMIHVHTWMRRIVAEAETRKFNLDLLAFCKKIEPYVTSYRRQIKSYNNTAHEHSEKKWNWLNFTPQLITKQKHGIIATLVSSFIGLAYEGISSFLHNKRNKALHKAVKDYGQQINNSTVTNPCN